jgi:hypothetical protein
MNWLRALLAALAATIAYYALGFASGPLLGASFQSSARALRARDDIVSYMPFGLAGTFVAMLVLAVLHASPTRSGSAVAHGAYLGLGIGVLLLCAGTIHEFVIFNVGVGLVVVEGVSALVQWTIAGAIVALVYGSVSRGAIAEKHP